MTGPFSLLKESILNKKYLALLCLTIILAPLYADIIYTDINASGSNNGSSWDNAYTSIITAYDTAKSGDEVWVKQGIYKLTSTGDRYASIVLKNDVALYGGFSGTEIKRQQRKWWEYETIITGDLNDNDNSNINTNEATRSENSMLCFWGASTNINTIIDGFTVKSFNGSSATGLHLVNGSSVTVRNCHFTENSSIVAVINSDESNSNIINCIFDKNYGKNCGYVLDFYTGQVNMSHCVVYGNSFVQGASPIRAIDLHYTKFNITNNIIYNNDGNGLEHRESSNYSPLNITYNVIENSVDGTGNSTADPCFRNISDFKIASTSYARGYGTRNIYIYDIDDADGDGDITETYPIDYCGFQYGTSPDRGAHEYGATRILVNDIESYQGLNPSSPEISWMFDEDAIGEQTSYTIQITKDPTFSSIDTWDSGQILSNDQSVPYGGSALSIGNTYYIRVYLIGTKASSGWITSSFKTNSLPDYTLLSPASESIVSTTDLEFKVLYKADPDGDEVKFTAYVYDDADLAGSMACSDTAVFWTDFTAEAPGDFATISPANGSQQDELTVDLTWETAVDPDPFDKVTYSVTFASDDSDSSTYITVNDLESTQLRQVLPSADTYLWRVTAMDQDGFRIESDNSTWMSLTVGEVSLAENDLPGNFALHANYPNPFNPMTRVKYDVAERTQVCLDVYNSRGQVIHSLVNETMNAGTYTATWNADHIGSGIYFIVMDAGEFHAVRKCLFVK